MASGPAQNTYGAIMIQAGKLRHRVVIQNPVETQDQNTGAVVINWVDVATVWASIEPLSAKEFVAAQALDSEISARITIRYRSDITAKMRLYHAHKRMYYDIHGILSDKNSGLEYITLPCSEGLRWQESGDLVPNYIFDGPDAIYDGLDRIFDGYGVS